MEQDAIIGKQTILNEYLSAGNAALEAGNHERAFELFNQLIKELPDEALGYAAMASVQSAMGQAQDAVVSLRRAVELMPEEAGMHNELGVAQLQQAVLRFPENGDVFAAFVKFKLTVDGAEGGRPALEQLRMIDPEHPEIPSFEDTIRELEECNS